MYSLLVSVYGCILWWDISLLGTWSIYILKFSILLKDFKNVSVFQSCRIRNDFSGSRFCLKFQIRPDPDPRIHNTGNMGPKYSSKLIYKKLLGSEACRTAGGTMDVPLYISLFSKAKSISGACVWTKTFAENFWHHQVGRWACMEQTSVKHFQCCINILNGSFSLSSCYLPLRFCGILFFLIGSFFINNNCGHIKKVFKVENKTLNL